MLSFVIKKIVGSYISQMTEEKAVVDVQCSCLLVDELPAILEKRLTVVDFGTYLIYVVIQ